MSTQRIINKCNEVFALANRLYGVDLSSKVHPQFNLKGRVAGWAGWKRKSSYGATTVTYTLRFNHDMITRGDAEALRDMEEDTVQHEIAHLICFARPELGRNHDGGWQRVCVALGGTGKRTHDTEVVYGKGATYEYTTDRGHKVRMSERHHKKVQAGIPLRYRKGKGIVTASCAHSIVGVQGRTLAAPIVRQPMNHPAVIEAAVRATKEVPVATLISPVLREITPVAPRAIAGESKAAVSRRLMLSGFNAGHSYETIINAMIAANGYDRQLARATFKANAPKIGIPSSFYA